MNWDALNEALNKINYDTGERQKAMSDEVIKFITAMEGEEEFNDLIILGDTND